MRNMLALVGAAVIGFGGVGWYLGWYKMSFSKSADGNLQVQTEVNTGKVKDDSGQALHQTGEFIGGHVDKVAQDAKQPGPPAGTPGPTTTPTPTPATKPVGDPDAVVLPAPPEPKKPIPLIGPK